MNRTYLLLLPILLYTACAGEPPAEIDIVEVLPAGASEEIRSAFPEFRALLVSDSETGVPFNDKFVVVEGVDDPDTRARMARYVVSYLEDPNKKTEEARQREAYENAPPVEKLAAFVERMKGHYPDFSYEWTDLDGGNVEATYGDNSLRISGVEDDGAREEIAHGLIQLQKAVDAIRPGEQE